MYFAINQDVQNIEAYHYFLNNIISTGNSYYTDLFKEIIEQTQKLLKTNNYYEVSSERFAIVKYFAQFPDIVNQIDVKNLKNVDIEKLMSCFDKHLSEAV